MTRPAAMIDIAEIVHHNLVVSGYAPTLDADQVEPLAEHLFTFLTSAGVELDEKAASAYFHTRDFVEAG